MIFPGIFCTISLALCGGYLYAMSILASLPARPMGSRPVEPDTAHVSIVSDDPRLGSHDAMSLEVAPESSDDELPPESSNDERPLDHDAR